MVVLLYSTIAHSYVAFCFIGILPGKSGEELPCLQPVWAPHPGWSADGAAQLQVENLKKKKKKHHLSTDLISFSCFHTMNHSQHSLRDTGGSTDKDAISSVVFSCDGAACGSHYITACTRFVPLCVLRIITWKRPNYQKECHRFPDNAMFWVIQFSATNIRVVYCRSAMSGISIRATSGASDNSKPHCFESASTYLCSVITLTTTTSFTWFIIVSDSRLIVSDQRLNVLLDLDMAFSQRSAVPSMWEQVLEPT